MKINTIKKILNGKFNSWADSIVKPELANMVKENSFITGGCIASMLMRETVNDFDIYFRNKETALAVAEYYVESFKTSGHEIKVHLDEESERIRIVTKSGHRGATGGAIEDEVIPSSGEIEDRYVEAEAKALDEKEDGKFNPVFFSTNAITLSGKIQLVLRFYGEPEDVHKNYDFVHCTNYWTSRDNNLVLRQDALESILSKELRYVGSLYPVCSIIRLRKFIARQWTVNAGQILKMLLQCGELDLTDPKILEDQLTGVDSAYFCQLIRAVHEKDEQKVTAAYLVEIIDRIF